jgi:hypothetical protein
MFRLFRRFFRPMSRPAALLLAWQHRKTLAMWARSIRDEAKRVRATGGRPDPARLKVLLPALWHQRDAAERGTVQSLTVTASCPAAPRAAHRRSRRVRTRASMYRSARRFLCRSGDPCPARVYESSDVGRGARRHAGRGVRPGRGVTARSAFPPPQEHP